MGEEGNWEKLRLKNEFLFSSSIKYISLLYSIYLGTQYLKKNHFISITLIIVGAKILELICQKVKEIND